MSKHAFFLNKGGSGGGGGTGGFALIKIEYPEGQEVTVTFDGETTTAPDTSGLWMYGCEETGTYTIAITGTTAEVEVEITTQGQIESVWISPQVINYALIYYLGNEFTNVAGTPEAKYAISTGGWGETGQVSILVESFGTIKSYYFKTANNINANGFTNVFSFRSKSRDCNVGSGTSYRTSSSSIEILFNNQVLTDNYLNKSNSFINSLFTNNNLPIYYGIWRDGGSTINRSSKESNYLKIALSYSGSSAQYIASVYAYGFVRTDDISGLSEYGNDIATILSNAVDLFEDTTALNWMCLNCTGDFMISALSNTNFVNAMNSSPNKSILVANEHWNRFIALLSV